MARREDSITVDRLRELLTYDALTGEIRWRPDIRAISKRRPGAIAGTLAKRDDGPIYRTIGIDGKIVLAHRVAWAMHNGKWPAGFVDHKNGDGQKNQIENLRECSHASNQQNRGLQRNNTSGFKGVYFSKKYGKWHAYSRAEGKRYFAGLHDTAEAAGLAAAALRDRLHGEFVNHG